MSHHVGFDIGGTKIAASIAVIEDLAMTVLDRIQFETPNSLDASLEKLKGCFSDLTRAAGLRSGDIDSIGISCGGPLDSKKGVILSPPNLLGWDDVAITDYFRGQFGVPAFLQNDADACALAEWRFGAGRGAGNMVFLTFGTGFGAGLILNGALYSGAGNMAGEIGHCRAPLTGCGAYSPTGYGKSGSFEGYCSGGGIAELGRMAALEALQSGRGAGFCKTAGDLPGITAKTIGDAARSGDADAIKVYRCSGERLGAALALLVDLLNPEVIVIGSVYARSVDLLRDSAMRVLEAESLPLNRGACRVLPAELGERLGDVAALTTAVYGLRLDMEPGLRLA